MTEVEKCVKRVMCIAVYIKNHPTMADRREAGETNYEFGFSSSRSGSTYDSVYYIYRNLTLQQQEEVNSIVSKSNIIIGVNNISYPI